MNLGVDPRDQMRNNERSQQELEKEKKKKREKEIKVKLREKIKLVKALKKFDSKKMNEAAQGKKGQKSAGNTAKT